MSIVRRYCWKTSILFQVESFRNFISSAWGLPIEHWPEVKMGFSEGGLEEQFHLQIGRGLNEVSPEATDSLGFEQSVVVDLQENAGQGIGNKEGFVRFGHLVDV
jgi:hypothetical protein